MVLVSECNLDCEQRELNTLANVIPSEDENSSICHQVVLPENDLIQVKNLEWSLFSLQYSVIWRWKDKQIHTPLGIPLNTYPFKITRVENLIHLQPKRLKNSYRLLLCRGGSQFFNLSVRFHQRS